ncbi:hypothetical protein AX14_011518 [Amanita brunnescens Koide BX004]|nr:hypothetical protein AX14_011518 [Amanita brunnescens Koide BX004]
MEMSMTLDFVCISLTPLYFHTTSPSFIPPATLMNAIVISVLGSLGWSDPNKQRYPLTEAQTRTLNLEKENNFRWVARSFATYSD